MLVVDPSQGEARLYVCVHAAKDLVLLSCLGLELPLQVFALSPTSAEFTCPSLYDQLHVPRKLHLARIGIMPVISNSESSNVLAH